jgi:hypothetical protein
MMTAVVGRGRPATRSRMADPLGEPASLGRPPDPFAEPPDHLRDVGESRFGMLVSEERHAGAGQLRDEIALGAVHDREIGLE